MDEKKEKKKTLTISKSFSKKVDPSSLVITKESKFIS